MATDTSTPPLPTRDYADNLRFRQELTAVLVITAADDGKVIECSFAGAVAASLHAGFPEGGNFLIQKTGAATDVTVTPVGGTIDGAANLRIGGAAGIGSAPFRRSLTNAANWFSA